MEEIDKTKKELAAELDKVKQENKALRLALDSRKHDDNYQILLDRIINLLPIRVFWKNLQLNYLGCNEVFANDAGHSKVVDLLGKSDYDLNWKSEASFYQADDTAVIESGIPKLNYEELQTTPTGEKIWLKTSKLPLTDGVGNVIGILGTYEDITAQKNIEALKKRNVELLIANEKADKMASLGVLMAGVSHEINNPLNFIKGAVDEISKELIDFEPAKQKEISILVDIINEGVSRSSAIVRGLSHFSRETNDFTEECDLLKVIDNCLVILNSKLKDRIEIVKEYSTSSFIINGNDGKLHQAFLNIISNAEQAMPKGGTIRISSKNIDGKMAISIQDTGEGISSENLSKIGDPFFTTKPPGQGTGLGLSITYKIIADHAGKINVTSEIDKGTNFELIFK